MPCKGQIISRIEINSKPPFDSKGSKFQRRLKNKLTLVHSTTNPDVVARFLALRPGMACSELRRLESERILRAQPFFADAVITPILDEAGGVYLSVVTQDELSLVVSGSGTSLSPYVKSFRLGEQNLMGEALSVVGGWRHSNNFRDYLFVRFTDYQFLGRPFQLNLDVARNELGSDWNFELAHPFLSELQRFSWRTTAGSRDEYRYFRRGDLRAPAVGLRRSYGDVGGVGSLGAPGARLALLGGSVSYEDERPEGFGTSVGHGTIERDTIASLIDRYGHHKSVRLNALAGIRDVDYLSVTGFESLDGKQDMKKGFELSTLVGRGYTAIGSQDSDLFGSANLYLGRGTPLAFAAFEGTIEGRRNNDTRAWDGILGSGRLATYTKPFTRHTFLTSLEWSGGWNQRIPFQLTLADRFGGPRGYGDSPIGGAQRFVLRVEDRIFGGTAKTTASFGFAPFMDLGKVYAGDSPFGVTSELAASVGLSLLVAAPPQSRRMWRLDMALPFRDQKGARFTVSLINRNFGSVFWREPQDIRRNRERSVPTSIFHWP